MDLLEIGLIFGLLSNVSYLFIFLRCIYNNPLNQILTVIQNSYHVIDWWFGWLGIGIISLSFFVMLCGLKFSKEPSFWIFIGFVLLGYSGLILLIASLL